MLRTVTAPVVGFVAKLFFGGISDGIVPELQPQIKERRYAARSASAHSQSANQPPVRTGDYHYVEGVGYIVGDVTCRFNARSAYLRCALNPCGPCHECAHYEPSTSEWSDSELTHSGCANSELIISDCTNSDLVSSDRANSDRADSEFL